MLSSIKRLTTTALILVAIGLAACAAPEGTPTPDLRNLQTRIAATMAAIPTAESLTPQPSDLPPATDVPMPVATEPPAVATEAPAAAPTQDYLVQAGDTLSTIAAKYNTSIAAIQLLNNLDDARVVRLGQRLKIPTAKIAPDENPYWILHVVQPGETLSTIAVRYSVRLEDVVRVNNITNVSLTRAGDRLVIPVKGPVT